MKTKFNTNGLATNPCGYNCEYLTPEIEVVSIAAEKGFAVSLTDEYGGVDITYEQTTWD